jgi:hypothetical protein
MATGLGCCGRAVISIARWYIKTASVLPAAFLAGEHTACVVIASGAFDQWIDGANS